MAIASRTNRGNINEKDWHSAGGSESGYIAPDPNDPNIVYIAGVYGSLTRFDKRTAQGQNITPWPLFLFNAELDKWRYRYPWTPALVFSPLEHGTLYFGSQYLMKTTDGGLHWQEISPDLTGASKLGVIYTIAPSPLQAAEIWVGSDTGLIHVTRNGGKNWTDVTPPGISEWSKVTHIEASHFDAGKVYAAIDRHRLDDYRPYLHRTHDYGKTWTQATEGLAEPAFLNAVREDPVRQGLLYAATEMGVYVSFDDGGHWQPLQLNLPVVSVRDLVVHGDDLVIATHGRSFWILDDIAPLRQANAQVAAAPVWLYKPVTAVRTSHESFLGTPLPPEIPKAANPPDGAILDYYFVAPQDRVVLEILDAKGQLVRRYKSTDKPAAPRLAGMVADIWITPPPQLGVNAGLHRFVWDLRYAAPGAEGPQVLPGKYQARLTAGGGTYTQAFQVLQDPRSVASPADLKSQLDLGLEATRAIEQAADITAQIQAAHIPGADSLLSELGKVSASLTAVLGVANSADRQPPSQAWALLEEAKQALKTQVSKWNELQKRAATNAH